MSPGSSDTIRDVSHHFIRPSGPCPHSKVSSVFSSRIHAVVTGLVLVRSQAEAELSTCHLFSDPLPFKFKLDKHSSPPGAIPGFLREELGPLRHKCVSVVGKITSQKGLGHQVCSIPVGKRQQPLPGALSSSVTLTHFILTRESFLSFYL